MDGSFTWRASAIGLVGMTISATARSTVAKLLGLIGSHHDAEALAAARKANQILEAHGTTWPLV